MQTLLENGRFSKQFLRGLKGSLDRTRPVQARVAPLSLHSYFLIGPFTSLGPLRNTPEAATGLLCGAIVGLVSVGGLIFGSTIKPTRFDKEGDKPAASLGGAVFAPALITIFGS
ncbi:Photosystem I reaction center subunit XI (PSI subunit V) (PSI-L) [Durusdinium trenchii]|uniref:Photosystem I reaction center subunit XI (PSI subunit V) (PSI-L) n=1 Tax=Durusdinium trenchii TaxID=1381693 RepID=A0ABP0NUI2_9DINO